MSTSNSFEKLQKETQKLVELRDKTIPEILNGIIPGKWKYCHSNALDYSYHYAFLDDGEIRYYIFSENSKKFLIIDHLSGETFANLDFEKFMKIYKSRLSKGYVDYRDFARRRGCGSNDSQ